jgi:hypothetical protein
MRRRHVLPVEHAALLERALRCVSRRFAVSEHRASLQKRHVQPLITKSIALTI